MTVSWWMGTILKLGDFVLKHHRRETFATIPVMGPHNKSILVRDVGSSFFRIRESQYGFTIVQLKHVGRCPKGKIEQCFFSGQSTYNVPKVECQCVFSLPILRGIYCMSQTCVILSYHFGIRTATVDFCFLAKHRVSALLAISACLFSMYSLVYSEA